jgi:AraC-like DNA-binding protein
VKTTVAKAQHAAAGQTPVFANVLLTEVFEEARALGVDTQAVVAQAKLGFDPAQTPVLEQPVVDITDLLDVCRLFLGNATNHPVFVPFVGRSLPGTFKIICSIACLQDTLGDAIEEVLQTHEFLRDDRGERVYANYRLSRLETGSARLNFQAPSTNSAVVTATALLMAHRFFCWLVDEHFALTQVALSAPATDNSRAIATLLDCEVVYNSEVDYLEFAASVLDKPVTHNKHTIRNFLHNAYWLLLGDNNLHALSISERVRSVILKSPQRFALTQAQVADLLHMSGSSLRRHLADEGTSFKMIRNSARLAMAQRLLTTTDHSFEQVSSTLGFSTPSAFYRFFKHNSGQSPGEFQRAVPGAS